jgi:hypothetical protein
MLDFGCCGHFERSQLIRLIETLVSRDLKRESRFTFSISAAAAISNDLN